MNGLGKGERIVFVIYQFCRNRGSVGRVFVLVGRGCVAWSRVWEGAVVV